MGKKCIKCGSMLEDNALYCDECGAKQEPIKDVRVEHNSKDTGNKDNSKKEKNTTNRKWYYSGVFLTILTVVLYPLAFILSILRFVKSDKQDKGYDTRSKILIGINGFLVVLMFIGMFQMKSATKWEEQYNQYMQEGKYQEALESVDEHYKDDINIYAVQYYFEIFEATGDYGKVDQVISGYYNNLEDKTEFDNEVWEKVKAVENILTEKQILSIEKIKEDVQRSINNKKAEEDLKTTIESEMEEIQETEPEPETLSEEEQIKNIRACIQSYQNSSEEKDINQLKTENKELVWKVLKEYISEEANKKDSSTVKEICSNIVNYCLIYETAFSEANDEIREVRQWVKEIDEKQTMVNTLELKYDFDIRKAGEYISSYEWYVASVLETEGVLGKIVDSVNSDGKTEWVAYNVEYLFGNAFPGEVRVVLRSDSDRIFEKSGPYWVDCILLDETKTLIDSKGFKSSANVYEIVASEAVWQDQSKIENAEMEISNLIDKLSFSSVSSGYAGESKIQNELSRENNNSGKITLQDYLGSWYTNRSSVSIRSSSENNCNINISWYGEEYGERWEWLISAKYNVSSGQIEYKDGRYQHVYYNEEEVVSLEIIYDNASGSFDIIDGELYWTDYIEPYNSGSFARESTATSVYVYPGVDRNTPYYADEGDTMSVPHELIPDSSEIYLNDSDVYYYTPDQLRYAKNEIYARNGRTFKDQELQQWFDAQSWYHGTIAPEDFNDDLLSKIEKANVQVIQHRMEVNSR